MNIFLIFNILMLCAGPVWAQDERQFRNMITGELTRPALQKVQERYYFKTRTPSYELDINDDDRNESIYFAKHDGEDWIFIKNYEGEKIFQYRFAPVGPNSTLTKISKRKLSKDHTVLILYYFEGVTRYLETQGTGKLFFISIDKGNLASMKISEGIYFWDEHKDFKGHYHQRANRVALIDYDSDGMKEINVYYRSISRIFKYKGNGVWRRFKRPWEH